MYEERLGKKHQRHGGVDRVSTHGSNGGWSGNTRNFCMDRQTTGSYWFLLFAIQWFDVNLSFKTPMLSVKLVHGHVAYPKNAASRRRPLDAALPKMAGKKRRKNLAEQRQNAVTRRKEAEKMVRRNISS